jgi:N6-L-threonylcarbamoyladenine synthase
VVDVLVAKTLRAAQQVDAKSIVLGGGVAANSLLRSEMQRVGSAAGFHVALPSKAMCTDNAAMIASAGWYRLRDHGPSGLDVGAIPHLSLTGSTVRGNRAGRK